MRASVLVRAGEVVVEERAEPPVPAGDVLVRVSSVGVCGSDVHYYREGRIGDFVVEAPLVLGHEASGVIEAVGAGVDAGRVGERVSIEPQRPAGFSPEVLAGRYNLDPGMEFFATPPVDGAFQELVSVPAHFAHPVPDWVSDDAAALMEPLSVGIAGARKAGVTVGDRVLIAGAGPIGLVLVQVARVFGASEIVVTDVSPERLAVAESMGATEVADARSADFAGQDRFTVFFDASGAAAAITAGLRALGPAGRAVLIGMGADEIPLPLALVQNKELTVTGTFRYANTWPTAIELVASGKVDLDALVSNHYGLDEVETALSTTQDAGVLKNMVTPSA